MNSRTLENNLRAGDFLLFNHKTFFGWIINIKTWSNVNHVEVYLGSGRVFTSKVKRGVGIYNLNTKNLTHIVRPTCKFNIKKGIEWAIKEAIGQKYDWKGILGFIKVVKGGDRDKQFCSESTTRFGRNSGMPLFLDVDADKVSPSYYLLLSNICDIIKV